jgi:hypothetical protein
MTGDRLRYGHASLKSAAGDLLEGKPYTASGSIHIFRGYSSNPHRVAAKAAPRRGRMDVEVRLPIESSRL